MYRRRLSRRCPNLTNYDKINLNNVKNTIRMHQQYNKIKTIKTYVKVNKTQIPDHKLYHHDPTVYQNDF